MGALTALDAVLTVATAAPADPTTPVVPVGDSGIPSLLGPILNVGIVGIILLCVVFKKFFVPEWTLKEAEERHTREMSAKDADIAELKLMVAEGTKQYNEQVIPALTRSIDVNREYVDLLRMSTPRSPRRSSSQSQ